jgi:ATP adenylyltransferase
MEYIAGPKGGPCIFCEFGELDPAHYRDKLVVLVAEHALVCLNRYPFAPCHLLVVPRRHVSELAALQAPEYASLMQLLLEATVRLRKVTGSAGMNVGFNLGAAAGAGIADHLHAHLVPRWIGDTNFMPVLADVHVMPEHLDETWAKLAPAFEDVPGKHPL